MPGHDPRERRLFSDIYEKNRLANEFRKLSGRLRRWQQRSLDRKAKRWQAQYGASIERGRRRLNELQQELLARAKDLKQRIQDEQSISKTEVQKFEKQYKKEVQELGQAQQSLEKLQADYAKAAAKGKGKGDDDADPAEAERRAAMLAELRRRRWSAMSDVRREKKEVRKAAENVASEAQDEAVLGYELRRVIAEIESLGA